MKRMRMFTCHVMIGIVLFSMMLSCSSKKDNYLSSLPANSTMVFKMNIPQMVQKSNVLNNPLALGVLMQLEQNIPATLKEQYAEFKKNPAACGLDIEQPLVISVEQADLNQPHVVGVLAIKDINKWEGLLKGISESESGLAISDADNGAKVISMAGEEELQCAYNDSRLVFSMGLDAVTLLLQPEEQSMLSHAHFADFAATKQDYAIFLDYGQLTDLIAKEAKSVTELSKMLTLLKDCSLFGELNFENGKVVGDAQIYASDALKDVQKQLIAVPSGKFLGLLPADSYCVYSGAVKNLQKQMEYMGEDMCRQLEASLAPYGLTLEMLADVQGDVLVGVYGDKANLSIPGVVMALECKDRALFEVVRKALNAPLADGKDMFEIAFLGYCVAYVDGALIAAPKSVYKECLADGRIGALADSMKDSALAKPLEKGGIVVDFQAIAESPLWDQLGSIGKVKALRSVCSQLDIFKIQMDSYSSCSGELTLADTEKNALEQLIAIGMSAAMAAN